MAQLNHASIQCVSLCSSPFNSRLRKLFELNYIWLGGLDKSSSTGISAKKAGTQPPQHHRLSHRFDFRRHRLPLLLLLFRPRRRGRHESSLAQPQKKISRVQAAMKFYKIRQETSCLRWSITSQIGLISIFCNFHQENALSVWMKLMNFRKQKATLTASLPGEVIHYFSIGNVTPD